MSQSPTAIRGDRLMLFLDVWHAFRSHHSDSGWFNPKHDNPQGFDIHGLSSALTEGAGFTNRAALQYATDSDVLMPTGLRAFLRDNVTQFGPLELVSPIPVWDGTRFDAAQAEIEGLKASLHGDGALEGWEAREALREQQCLEIRLEEWRGHTRLFQLIALGELSADDFKEI